MQKFERYEFKYVLPSWVMNEIESEIMNFMEYDKFVKNKNNHSYFVRSIYFENQQNDNFYEKIDGIKYRTKYRIRTYSKIFNKNIFLEKKSKDNDRVFKKRIKVSKSNFYKIMDNKIQNIELKNLNEKNFYSDFIFKITKKEEFPKIIIDYNRKPLVSDYDSYFRISIDYNLIARSKNLKQMINCLPDYKIMEVKFFRRIPLWFLRIIQKYNLKRVSISKFVVGMKFLRYAEDLS